MRRPAIVAALLLAVATVGVFSGVGGLEFVSYDDPSYITANAVVQRGLSLEGLGWAFTTTRAHNWHPLTWLSHMLDVELFGLRAGGHHLVNLLLHLANSLLLLFVLRAMTGALWRSAAVAALFALHPLHVESVAWVSERKDVLSAFFGLLAMGAYTAYAAKPSAGRYLLVLAPFVLGLLAKPMLVTLPLVLLLLDFWPLARMGDSFRGLKRCLLEKIPLLALSAAASIVTIAVQRGVIGSLEGTPPGLRIANAFVSTATYLRKMIWPMDLAVLYPFPESLPAAHVAASGMLLLALSLLVFFFRRQRPYLVTGWLFFLVMLLPVSGLLKVGVMAMADRYTYLPMIGVFIMLAWAGGDLVERLRLRPAVTALLATVLLAPLALRSHVQTAYWQNSATLFSRALEVTSGNWVAHANLGVHHEWKGDLAAAIPHFREALRLKPGFGDNHYNLGQALARAGAFEEGLPHLRAALSFRPEDPDIHFNLARVFLALGNRQEADRHMAAAYRLKPSLFKRSGSPP